MTISAENIGKKFGRNWIFRKLNFTTVDGDKLAITGNNGSGKSTLLQILSGYLTPSEGQILYNGNKIAIDYFIPIGYSAPYIEVPEEFTLIEMMNFHANFRTQRITTEEIAEKTGLPMNKPIGDFSTGMKQRVQLSMIFYFENELIFMDEPTANLDETGYSWWRSEVMKLEKTLVIASNQKREVEVCGSEIKLN